MTLQLNKLEQEGKSCLAYLVVENTAESAYDSLTLDLVMFDGDGIIARRLAVETAPLPAGKTSVKVFRIDELPCDAIGRVLLNDILACEDETGDHDDCLSRLDTESVAGVPFIQ
ncbi:Tat pathway signal sequence domain protein [Arhodomonas sp. SL1]|uniref:Tat pathway signal sequence domain protein n=1 Tax=Arhodomonas sp. SL1 TaxID=3425691 RepID=UPI003F882800